jgi:hypothetical protein
LFDQLGNQAGPAGLVTRADAGAIVAVEILVEKDQVPPVGIALKKFGATGYRTAAALPAHENMN